MLKVAFQLVLMYLRRSSGDKTTGENPRMKSTRTNFVPRESSHPTLANYCTMPYLSLGQFYRSKSLTLKGKLASGNYAE